MNQILITQKLYVTPELKRKKKMYKVKFFLSVFLVCCLFSYYIYAEYDRNKNEEISQEILAHINLSIEEEDDTTVRIENNILIVTLDEETANKQEIDITKLAKDAEEYIQHNIEEQQNLNTETTNNTGASQEQQQSQPQTTQRQEQQTYTTQSGGNYTTDSIVNIPSLGIKYPVLKTDEANMDAVLEISIVKFWGCNPNEVGNYVIVGHNYKNKKMFGKLSSIKNGDVVEITDLTGRTLKYAVYDKYKVSPTDTKCTSQITNGNKEITLITCSNYGTQRLVVKAREIK